MELPDFNAMPHVIPPIISDTPPPLDVLIDEDDGFGDFGVASNLGLDLSDSTAGSDDWKAQTYSSILPEDDKNDILPIADSNIGNEDIFPPILNERTDIIVGENCSETVIDEKELVSDDLESDSPDVEEELNRISHSPVLSSCNVELDVRTSPEGADDDNNCVSENVMLCDFPQPTISETCELDIKDNLDDAVNESSSVSKSEAEEDGFTDFADFSSQPFPQGSEMAVSEFNDIADENDLIKSAEADDDFDDFDDFESAAPPLFISEPEQIKGENMNSKLSSIFGINNEDVDEPSADVRLTECLHACLDDSSSVWGHLKDLEASFALSLQWNGSNASRKLLSSLSVDSRNILIGQRWNPSMPRFAANIGCTPLEPMKAASDDASPIPNESIPNAIPPVPEEVVPAAQFDWNSSGLTNPLDCLEEEKATAVRNPTQLILEERNDTPNPVENPLTDLWSKPDIPITDILLPTPNDTIATSLVKEMISGTNNLNILNGLDADDWIQDTTLKPMSTISSNLEKVELKTVSEEEILSSELVSNNMNIIEEPKRMSSEAYRVVETLPDLSFLSARKLLYAANANMARFQASARP